MATKKILPRIEVILILVFLGLFIVWSVGRCNATRAQYQAAAQENMEEADSTPPPRTPAATPPAPRPARSALDSMRAIGTEAAARSQDSYSRLYIVIDGVNVREKPTLDGRILDRLGLFEEVAFVGEVTDFTQEIKLGEITTNEPWVKVKTPKGKVGWVYGAGVNYYKKKREGAE